MIGNTEITVAIIIGLFLLVGLAVNKLSQVKVNCSKELNRITVLEETVNDLNATIEKLKA